MIVDLLWDSYQEEMQNAGDLITMENFQHPGMETLHQDD